MSEKRSENGRMKRGVKRIEEEVKEGKVEDERKEEVRQEGYRERKTTRWR